jgi:hypothetical protein
MDYKEIVRNAKKYHYYAVSQNTLAFLSSSNSKSEAKKLALEKLRPNIDNLIGKKLVYVKIKSVKKEFEKQKTSDDLKVIGGPILFTFDRGVIQSIDKITNIKTGGNNEVYLSDKYIKKHKNNVAFDLKQLVRDFVSEKFKQGLLAITIL